MSDVVGILASTQHASLTALSNCMNDSTFEGLTAAAREAKRRGLIPAALARKCERLDIAAHYARHTATAKGAAFIQVLTTALPSPTVLPACHRPTAEDPENGSDLYTGEKEVEEKSGSTEAIDAKEKAPVPPSPRPLATVVILTCNRPK